ALFTFVSLLCMVFASECFSQPTYKEITSGSWDLFLSDHGVIGKDNSNSGGTWPRGSSAANYLNSSGIWFGCVRKSAPSQQLVEMTYTPVGAASFTPFNIGGVQEPVYSSSDYNKDGTPKQGGLPAWCIRNTTHVPLLREQNLGTYVPSYFARAKDTAAFISDQDNVSIFSDSANIQASYPIGIIGTLTTYAWNTDSLKNCVFVRCTIKNTSKDTLMQCFAAPVFDFALGTDTTNDNIEPYYNDSLRMFDAFSDSEAVALGLAGVALIQPAGRFQGEFLWSRSLDQLYASSAYYKSIAMQQSGLQQAPVNTATVRGLSASGPFTLLPDSSIQFTYILAAAMVPGGDKDTNDHELIQTLLAARNWWYAFNPPTSVAENPLVATNDEIVSYPNPFNSFTTIETPIAGDHIAVYNSIGQEVSRALLHRVSPTEYLFDGNTLTNGVYIVRLSGAGKTYTSQLIIIH
ncbi:MAG TPA: T9SS type A sorting domain-containing protein, partial [Candidatus Kapabacteria bacterium]|nr:T9SS type A sorting domain-containing protein [Candidatus Kapabacteria bacterium]